MSPWDEPWRDVKLRELWPTGLSTIQIAIALKLGAKGKNAVIGRAHRLALLRRSSPIRTRDGSKYVAPPKQPGVWEIARARAAQERRVVVLSEQQILLPTDAPIKRFADCRTAKSDAPPAEPRVAPGEAGGCTFIEGLPKGRHTVFCDAPRQRGSSYCPEHHARCWSPRTQRQAEPAAVVRSVEDARAAVDGGHAG